ncbi:hypothetical protein [Kingella kingae]|uniref:hypothetical protein n=1 Tax=Kingella kingae TaxID=504 RepID=UPI0012BD0065|nr:hypothetical protein [Kingella kingae]
MTLTYIFKLGKIIKFNNGYGIDSMRFYGEEGVSEDLNHFMQIRLEVMKKLAKI